VRPFDWPPKAAAAMQGDADTNRTGAISGLYLWPLASRLSACVARQQSNARPPFVFVPSLLL